MLQNIVKSGSATFEPVTLAECKAHCYISHSADDTYVTQLRIAAREQVETDLGFSVAGQSFIYYTENSIPSALYLPYNLVRTVTSITYKDEAEDVQTLDDSLYEVLTYKTPAVINFETGIPSTSSDMTVTYVAGYLDASSVPALIKHAILFLVGGWYEERSPLTDKGWVKSVIPLGYDRIVKKLKSTRVV